MRGPKPAVPPSALFLRQALRPTARWPLRATGSVSAGQASTGGQRASRAASQGPPVLAACAEAVAGMQRERAACWSGTAGSCARALAGELCGRRVRPTAKFQTHGCEVVPSPRERALKQEDCKRCRSPPWSHVGSPAEPCRAETREACATRSDRAVTAGVRWDGARLSRTPATAVGRPCSKNQFSAMTYSVESSRAGSSE